MSPIAQQLNGTILSEFGRQPATRRRTGVPHSRLGDNAQVDKALAGHEHLDCTGFMHMGGRLYDPRIGRFLSPDPIISDPASGQGWNLYSYVGNSPLSGADPSGLCFTTGPHCPGAHGGGGFTRVSPVLTSRHFFWRHHIQRAILWALDGFRFSLSDSDYPWRRLVPIASFFIIRSELDSVPRSQSVSLSQEASPADASMSSPLPPWLTFTPGEAASIGIGFIPLVGTAASVYEVATGRDLVTGDEVHRGMALIGVVPGGKLIRAAVRETGTEVSNATLRRRLRRALEAERPPPAHISKPEAHHDLPLQFRDDFESAGFDLKDPRYGRWVGQSAHRSWHKRYNKEWGDFLMRNLHALAKRYWTSSGIC